jgi:anti-sigma regulatory factor (Ser/Thr protein kinase)
LPSAWNENVDEVIAVIAKINRELANVFCHSICTKLKARDLSKATIHDFERVFGELAMNAYVHGCANNADNIRFNATIFGGGVTLSVSNENKTAKIPMTIKEIAENYTKFLQTNTTGRGLPLVYSLVDQFDLIEDGTGVKVVIFDHDFSREFCASEGISFISIGNYLGDYIERLNATLAATSGDVVLIFSDRGSEGIGSVSAVARSLQQVLLQAAVGRFAIVIADEIAKFLPNPKQHFPRFIGYFATVEDAVHAFDRGLGSD